MSGGLSSPTGRLESRKIQLPSKDGAVKKNLQICYCSYGRCSVSRKNIIKRLFKPSWVRVCVCACAAFTRCWAPAALAPGLRRDAIKDGGL